MTRTQRGFTLIETVVALAIAGLVLLAARGIGEQVTAVAARIVARREAVDSVATAMLRLRALLEQVEVGATNNETFEGSASELRFTSWCQTAAGWQERCVVRLSFRERDAAVVLEATTNGREITVLHADGGPLGFAFLRRSAEGDVWLPRWDASLLVPLALLVALGRDTMLLRIGERG